MVAKTLKGFVQLIRPHNLFVASLTTLIGYTTFLQDASSLSAELLYQSLKAICVVVAIAAAGYVINDYYDVETDAISKPWRPIVAGLVSMKTARATAYVLFFLGLLLALAFYLHSIFIIFYTAVNALLVHEYSRWIKRTGFLGNLVVAFNSASTIIYGTLAASYEAYGRIFVRVYPLIPALYAFLLVLGREVVKGIEDVEGDSFAGVKTLAVRYGVEHAFMVAAALLLIVILLSPIPFIVGLYNVYYFVLAISVDVLILYSIVLLAKAVRTKHLASIVTAARSARSLLKGAFALGAIAFIVGCL